MSRRLPQSRTKTRIGRVVGSRAEQGLARTPWSRRPHRPRRVRGGTHEAARSARCSGAACTTRTTSTSCAPRRRRTGLRRRGRQRRPDLHPRLAERDRGTCDRGRTGPGQLREVDGLRRLANEPTAREPTPAEHRPRRRARSAEAVKEGSASTSDNAVVALAGEPGPEVPVETLDATCDGARPRAARHGQDRRGGSSGVSEAGDACDRFRPIVYGEFNNAADASPAARHSTTCGRSSSRSATGASRSQTDSSSRRSLIRRPTWATWSWCLRRSWRGWQTAACAADTPLTRPKGERWSGGPACSDAVPRRVRAGAGAPSSTSECGQTAMATSATEPTWATTFWSTASARGARVRSVHSPSPAKKRK